MCSSSICKELLKDIASCSVVLQLPPIWERGYIRAFSGQRWHSEGVSVTLLPGTSVTDAYVRPCFFLWVRMYKAEHLFGVGKVALNSNSSHYLPVKREQRVQLPSITSVSFFFFNFLPYSWQDQSASFIFLHMGGIS